MADVVSADPIGAGASPSNSGWNHFGRLGVMARPGGVGGNGDVMASYPFAFSLALSYDSAIDQVVSNKARRLFFPVNPEAIGLPRTRMVSGVDVIAGRQATQVGNTQLRTVTFESLFPMAYDSDYCNPVPQPGIPSTVPALDRTPRQSVEFIEASMSGTDPLYLHFIAGDVPTGATVALPPALRCFVTNFEPRYQAGHPLDIFFTIELTEYNPPVVGTRVNTSARPRDPSTAITRAGGVTTNNGRYSTLAKIASAVYGTNFSIGWRQLLVDTQGAGITLVTTKSTSAKIKKVTGPSQRLKPGQRVIVKPFRGVGI